jgi:cardiolipin synthase
MDQAGWYAAGVFVADLAIRVGLSLRVIMRRRPVGVSLAWLMLVLAVPFVGALVYLLVGELRLGSRRARRAVALREVYREWRADLHERWRIDWAGLCEACAPLSQLGKAALGIPAAPENELRLLADATQVFRSLITDIDAARRTCHLEFYIWHAGGMADEVAAALIRAAQRGVICRVLVDAVGSHDFLRTRSCRELRHSGVQIHAALKAGLLRMLFVRFDLRMHRKIAVIDGEVAYTGSMNLVDPRFFKQDAGVGQWIDAMVRVRGPVVEGLAGTFLSDWELETGVGLDALRNTGDFHPLAGAGTAVVQVLPSGPASNFEAIQDVLLMAIYSARRELILTTPYFVPGEALVSAIASAARRGVDVKLILPAHVDSLLVRLASQAHRGDLVAAGVHVMEFEGGLLHTKSVTIDGEISLFGSLNLDPRSLNLNFEITLAVYDTAFTAELRALQRTYLEACRPMDLAVWRSRSKARQVAENIGRLLSPLL